MHKMLRNLTEKLRAKLPATTHGYSMVNLPVSTMPSQCFFEVEASPAEGQTMQQKDKIKKREKGKANPKAFVLQWEKVIPYL